MTGDSVQEFIRGLLHEMREFRRELNNLTTESRISTVERQHLRGTVNKLTEDLEEIEKWIRESDPKLSRLYDSSEDTNRRRKDLIWAVLTAIAVTLAGTLLATKYL